MYIDHDNGPRARNNGIYVSIYMYVSIYVCIIYPAFVVPWFPNSVYALKCFLYYWRTHMCELQLHSTEQQGQLELLVCAMKIINEDR